MSSEAGKGEVTMPKCKDCDWWKLIEDKSGQLNGGVKGRCRGRAPTVTAVVMPVMHQIIGKVTPQILEVTVWPITGAVNEACGDFRDSIIRSDAEVQAARQAKRGGKDVNG